MAKSDISLIKVIYLQRCIQSRPVCYCHSVDTVSWNTLIRNNTREKERGRERERECSESPKYSVPLLPH